jgi:large subunit ribosomal protein L21
VQAAYSPPALDGPPDFFAVRLVFAGTFGVRPTAPARGVIAANKRMRNMYAVIQTGGKQYRVANGDVITVEKLDGEAGSTLAIEPVLMVNDGKNTQVGTPIVEGAAVTAEVVEQTRGKKIVVFKKKRRQGYQRTRGHRQELTVLRVVDVTGKAKKPAAKKPAAKKPAADKE